MTLRPRQKAVVYAHLPVATSPSVRKFFIATALLSIVLIAWVNSLREEGQIYGLSLIFMRLFLQQDGDALLGTLLLLLVLCLLPGWPGARRIPIWIARQPWTVCLVTAGVLGLGSLFVYRAQPLSMDEYAPVFQSQAFASGHLTGRFPLAEMDWLIPTFFQNIFLRISPASGAVISAYWPSFALLLTPFTWLGIPWACNAVVSALTIATIRKLALALFASTESAGLAMLFTLASPVFFADGISYYAMTAHLLCNSLFALLLLQPTARRLVLAGLVGSVALTLHNPLPHALFALPWILWLAQRRRGVRDLACLAAGYLPLGLPLLVGWFWFSSDLMHQGATTAHADQLKTVGSLMTWPSATVLLARLIGLAKVWIWAVPGLLVLAVAGAWRWRREPRCVLLAASALLTYLGYFFFVPDQGHGWGFRYFHSAWLALPLLAAGALTPRADSDARLAPSVDAPLNAFVTTAALLMLLAGVPLRACQIGSYMAFHVAQLPAYSGTEPRIVLINPRTTVFGNDLVQNDPLLRGNVIRMQLGRPDQVAALMKEFRPTFRRVFADAHGEVWSAR